MQKHLTDLAVQALPPGTYHDTKTPAFGIRVGKNRKTWFLTHAKTRKREPLGHYPAMSLQEARKAALRSLVAPTQEKPTISFSEAREAFLALPRWRFHSRRVLISSLKHFTWKRNLDRITHEDVATALEAIKAPSARAHALKDIRTFFNWTVPRYLDRSPAEGLKMDAQPSRDRILTHDEIKRVWIAAETMGYPFGTIIKLLLLTGCRKMEIGSLTWNQIQEKTMTIPASVAKNGREHTIPIAQLAISLMPTRRSLAHHYIFCATDTEKRYNGYAFHLKELQKISGTTNWVLHDLRRTFASLHAEIGTPIHIIEKMLNHVSGQISGVALIYNRYSYMTEMREACERYETFIQEIVS